MASEEKFDYGPRLVGRKIRLIRAKQGQGLTQAILEVTLTEQNLDTAHFEALSYVWGDQTAKHLISCNDHPMYIGLSLFEVLSERARRGFTDLIWVDALCINQDDDKEKTSQVQMMRDIYNKARKVIVWLGPGDPRTDKFGIAHAKTLYFKREMGANKLYHATYKFDTFYHGSGGHPPRSKLWNALFRILGHSWFSRIWVVQELLVSQNSVFWRGKGTIGTRVIIWVIMLVARHKNLYEAFDILMGSPETSLFFARSVASGYIWYNESGPRSIYDTVSYFNGMKSTDPRDRFFALAGISSGLDPAFVNYEKSHTDIACLVGKMALLGFPVYNVASHDGEERLELDKFSVGSCSSHKALVEWLTFHSNPQNHSLSIPSWVPDLLSPHSPGLILSGFYNTNWLIQTRNVSHPEVKLKKDEFITWSGPLHGELSPIPVPDEIHIMGAIFDSVETLASNRPRVPKGRELEHLRQSDCRTFTRNDFTAAFDSAARYETKMITWLSEIRLLMDPTLEATDSIVSGSQQSFSSFWRLLVYNRGELESGISAGKAPDDGLGASFGYWYLQKKLYAKRDLQEWACFYTLLEYLSAPFEKAERRVRGARRFFVSGQGRSGWVPFRTEIGDQVCVFRGLRTPLIVRKCSKRWEIIGPCYVHDMMDGEIWDIKGVDWDFMSFI